MGYHWIRTSRELQSFKRTILVIVFLCNNAAVCRCTNRTDATITPKGLAASDSTPTHCPVSYRSRKYVLVSDLLGNYLNYQYSSRGRRKMKFSIGKNK